MIVAAVLTSEQDTNKISSSVSQQIRNWRALQEPGLLPVRVVPVDDIIEEIVVIIDSNSNSSEDD